MDEKELHHLALEREKAGSLRLTPFFGHKALAAKIGPWVFSQWYDHPFTHDGVQYLTNEHYMMARKALLFADQQSYHSIISAPTPKRAKELGRAVRGFDDAIWCEHRFSIVTEGSCLKFASDPSLREYLLSTVGTLLVEASPYDRIWGIGMGVSDTRVSKPSQWRGLNLLGYALVNARTSLQ